MDTNTLTQLLNNDPGVKAASDRINSINAEIDSLESQRQDNLNNAISETQEANNTNGLLHPNVKKAHQENASRYTGLANSQLTDITRLKTDLQTAISDYATAKAAAISKDQQKLVTEQLSADTAQSKADAVASAAKLQASVQATSAQAAIDKRKTYIIIGIVVIAILAATSYFILKRKKA